VLDGTAPVTEPTQRRQALAHEPGAVMVAAQPRQLPEADRRVRDVFLAAGCLGQRLALDQPPVHLVVGDARVDRPCAMTNSVLAAYT
jgi:hypothetical protein